MKIAHVTPYFHPEFYGSHEAFLSKELAARGHEVVLFTSDRMPKWGGAKGLTEQLPRGESEWRGVRIVRVAAGPTVSFVPSLPALPRQLAREPFDLYLSHEVFSIVAWHTMRAAQTAARPFVLVQHGYRGGRRPAFRALFQLQFRLMGRHVLRKADASIALTQLGRDFLLGLGADAGRVHVLPTGVDTALFRPIHREASDELVFGSLGRVEADKGVFDMLAAFDEARKATGRTQDRLRIAGEGEALPELRERVEALGLASHVDFLGRLPHAQVPEYLARLDVMLMPTRVTEPFGIVAVEAAAAGIPTIASRVGGLAETVSHGSTGCLVDPGDVGSLAGAISAAMRDRGRLEAMGRQARERASELYCWKRIAARFEAMFAELAAGGGATTPIAAGRRAA